MVWNDVGMMMGFFGIDDGFDEVCYIMIWVVGGGIVFGGCY